jgi:ubiquinone/menaquinone biosynthesis C-methylase UbiE
VELLRPVQEEGELLEAGEEPQLGFTRITGVDPSPQMIEKAVAHAATLGPLGASLKFVQSPAENLKFLDDRSVDMVVAGALRISICWRWV